MLEITVFLSGALVMVLEMVGARVLAPHVGTSAIVWTSLIGVVLACLALGAWAGGRFADKKLSRAGLAQMLLGAGLGTGVTALCHAAIGESLGGIGNLYVAAVLSALAIFAVPAFFFGAISPYVIRLRLSSVDTAGATVGWLYALSTTGSIVGTFLGGFVLISYMGSRAILWLVCLVMLALAVAHCLAEHKGGKGKGKMAQTARGLLLFVACGVLAFGDVWIAVPPAGSMPSLVESPYNSIRLLEGHDRSKGNRAVRLMSTDPDASQSGMLVDAPNELYFEYTRHYALGPRFVPHAKRILMLGGGGYSVPKWLLAGQSGLAPDLKLTVVELDSAMTDCARKYFALPDDPRMRVEHQDARIFLNWQNEQYDLVFVDVFNSSYAIPFQMGTVEAAQAMRRAVAPGGALLMNVIAAAEGPDSLLFQSICGSLRTAFAEVRVFLVTRPDRPDMVQNLMLLALPEPGREAQQLTVAASPNASETNLMLASQYTTKAFSVPPLEDSFAPVERYAITLMGK